MTAALARLSLNAAEVQLEGHLPECGLRRGDWRTCQWCLSAIDTPELRTLQELLNDAETLLGESDPDTIPWVVAVTQLQHTVDAIDLPPWRVRSVEHINRTLERRLRLHVNSLAERMAVATATGGPIARRCITTSGLLAAVAVQSATHIDTLAELPPDIRGAIAELKSTLAPETQLSGLDATIDEDHRWQRPRLHTQPEWGVLPAPGTRRSHRSKPTDEPSFSPGSLEALVVESVISEVIAELSHIGDRLDGLRPPVTLERSISDPPFSSQTRSLVWRHARIDWTLSFIDTGQADCWNTRIVDGHTVTDIPWTVALAIETRKNLGFVSAIRDG